MAWPSGTKASTNNVDAGTDLLSLARPDIKQNIDNVNDIIDHLNISSPNDGDLLQYSSSTGKWEQVASGTVGVTTASITVNNDELFTSGSTETYFADYAINSDTTSIISAPDSAGTVTITSGKYQVIVYGRFTGGATNNPDWTLSILGNDFVIEDETFNNYVAFIDFTSGNTGDITLTGQNGSSILNIAFDVEVFLTKIG